MVPFSFFGLAWVAGGIVFFAHVRLLAKLPFSSFNVCFDKKLVSDVIDSKGTVSDLTLDSSTAL